MLEKMFGSKKNVQSWWKRLHNEKFYVLYSSPNIIRVMKSRQMRSMWRLWKVGEKRTVFWLGDLEKRRLDERIILKWMFKNWVCEV
jgi:hypothetical protein